MIRNKTEIYCVAGQHGSPVAYDLPGVSPMFQLRNVPSAHDTVSSPSYKTFKSAHEHDPTNF